ncbi:hypothetical protein [Klebsiella aerogenes]|uniref:hypothetical protein n=1 Tax=Klebsiella aerogenes TaxID=548 RepID=UPI00292DB53E|nr:hypothetical protein [Klebsiella aerogenes]
MKVKLDFVSNSSSTSFVYISDEELSEDSFLKAAGVDKNGPVGELFCKLHYELYMAIEHYGKQIKTKDAANELAGTHEFTPEVIEKMKEAIDQGKRVVTSELSSDGSFAESLLCMAMFEIESDQFYINAFNNCW